ncbi:MAG: endonuclease domain-containing protein [Betaproteobacteria bacterium]|nr:MAG: endonuclease domain-containing protein [Betaproteobacteria bacterium]
MKRLARSLRKNQTDAERKLWRRLRARELCGFKFRRQYPIAPYIVDFICVEKRLIVEVDGGQHTAMSEADRARTRFLNDRGYRVLTFWDNDALLRTDEVLARILEFLGDPHPSPLPQAGEGTFR